MRLIKVSLTVIIILGQRLDCNLFVSRYRRDSFYYIPLENDTEQNTIFRSLVHPRALTLNNQLDGSKL